MNDQKPVETPRDDGFAYVEMYPEPAGIFRTVSWNEVKDSALIVLDANVLLLPYSFTKLAMNELKKLYKSLSANERLLVPGHAAREFAVHRGKYIHELRDKVHAEVRKPSHAELQAPFLEELREFQEVKRIATEIKKLKQWKDLESACQSLEKTIREWHWQDPLSVFYGETFSAKAVVDIDLSSKELRDQIVADAERRAFNSMGPGFKDLNKDVNRYGDLIIWHTILEIASKRKQHVVFLTGDLKSDWLDRKLYPRFELVVEFSKRSEGKSLYVMTLAEYLERQGVGENVVKEVSLKQMEASRGDTPRVAEARAALLRMRERALVTYASDSTRTMNRASLRFGPTELDGEHFSDSNYTVTSTAPGEWVAQCSGVFNLPPTSLVIRANLLNGEYAFNL